MTILLVAFYLLHGPAKNSILESESEYENARVVPDTQKYEKLPEEVVVDNGDQGVGAGAGGEVIEEPEFQPEINQVDDDQIGEPPQPKPNAMKFNGKWDPKFEYKLSFINLFLRIFS